MKSIVLFIIIIVIISIISWGFYIRNFSYTPMLSSPYHTSLQTKSCVGNILILFSSKEKAGGGKTYTLNHYKTLLQHNQPTFFLTVKNAPIIQELKKEQLPFYTCNSFKVSFGNFFWQPGLESAIYHICKEKNISIIHANNCREVAAAKKIAQKLPVKIVYTRHITNQLDYATIDASDGIIGVSKKVTDYVTQECSTPQFANKKIIYIPPFLNEKAFKEFTPKRSKEQFFQDLFAITIKPYPIVCKIANFYADINHKNHPLLFKAIAKLIHEHNIPVQIMLAGDGVNRSLYERMVQELDIKLYVHFLGNINQNTIIELLHHCTINVLASSNEAFGIALLEAAMMKKPSIIATGTGAAEEFILHEKTGLLFENNNIESFTLAIKHLIESPTECFKLGNNAYDHFKKHFSNDVTATKMLQFYQQIVTI